LIEQVEAILCAAFSSEDSCEHPLPRVELEGVIDGSFRAVDKEPSISNGADIRDVNDRAGTTITDGAFSTVDANRRFRIVSSDANWLSLHLRAVLPNELLHRATLASYVFALPVRGYSLQEQLVAAGWARCAKCDRTVLASEIETAGGPACTHHPASGIAGVVSVP
jgi:hypothetical protein